MRTLSITGPDDWHVHLRDNDALKHTVPATAHSEQGAHSIRALYPILSERIELAKASQVIPQTLAFGHDQVVPLAAGSTLQWSIHEST